MTKPPSPAPNYKLELQLDSVAFLFARIHLEAATMSAEKKAEILNLIDARLVALEIALRKEE